MADEQHLRRSHQGQDTVEAADGFRPPTPQGKRLRRVRRPVLESWKRSQSARVCPDSPVARYSEPVLEGDLLGQISGPRLRRLVDDLRDEPVAVLVTDPRGVVIHREAGNRAILRRLDRINLAPGFSYNEEHMGTNGIGTALEYGSSILIDGDEHYAGSLTRFSCAGVPITHPLTGGVIGVLDITLDADRSNPLLLPMARQVAERLREALVESTSLADRALLAEFLRASNAATSLIAVGRQFTLLNPAAQRAFGPADQATLLEHAREKQEQGTTILELPSGGTARLYAQLPEIDGRPAGALIRIQPQPTSSTSPPVAAAAVPGLAGSGPVWRRTVHRALTIRQRREWLVVEGEPGSGRLALLLAVESTVAPARAPAVLDARGLDADALIDQVGAALEEARTLIITHADQLTSDRVEELCGLFAPLAGDPDAPFIALTCNGPVGGQLVHTLLTLFQHTLRVPPLRHHMEDLPELVRHLVGQRGAELRFSPAALAQLGRLPWQGNVTELRDAVAAVVRTRRSGTVEPEDLPAQCRAVTRRQLTAMDWLERDAIVDALDTHGGNKQRAASALGMSRATIYRKIRDYGLS